MTYSYFYMYPCFGEQALTLGLCYSDTHENDYIEINRDDENVYICLLGKGVSLGELIDAVLLFVEAEQKREDECKALPEQDAMRYDLLLADHYQLHNIVPFRSSYDITIAVDEQQLTHVYFFDPKEFRLILFSRYSRRTNEYKKIYESLFLGLSLRLLDSILHGNGLEENQDKILRREIESERISQHEFQQLYHYLQELKGDTSANNGNPSKRIAALIETTMLLNDVTDGQVENTQNRFNSVLNSLTNIIYS